MALSDQFSDVGLKLEPAKAAFGNNPRIFGLDIQGDKFRAWVPSHVIASVQARDPKMHQVVLTVKEPVTTFQIEVFKFEVLKTDKVLREIPNLRSGRQGRVLVERKTTDETRHFLCGVDERNHPFIARLPGGASSIQAAHELLKPPEVRGKRVKGYGKNYKSKGDGSVYRQGEWFFEKASQEELARIETYAKAGTQKKVAVAPTSGNPHVVDERVVVPATAGKHGRNFPATTYVRGKLRHAEHETLEFRDWMRVYKNQEAGGATAGANWVD